MCPKRQPKLYNKDQKMQKIKNDAVWSKAALSISFGLRSGKPASHRHDNNFDKQINNRAHENACSSAYGLIWFVSERNCSTRSIDLCLVPYQSHGLSVPPNSFPSFRSVSTFERLVSWSQFYKRNMLTHRIDYILYGVEHITCHKHNQTLLQITKKVLGNEIYTLKAS